MKLHIAQSCSQMAADKIAALRRTSLFGELAQV